MRVILCASVGIGLLLWASTAGVGQPSEAAAVAATRKRQECVKTLLMEYRQSEEIAVGGISEGGLPPFDPKKPVPSEETTLESTNRLVMDGEKLRCETEHPLWSVPDGKFYRKKRVSVFDGSIAKTFQPNGIGSDDTPTGVLPGEPRLNDVKSSVLLPVTLTIRGLNPAISPYPMGDIKLSGGKLPIDGTPCQEYVLEFSSDLTLSFWFDPAKDNALRRIRTQSSSGIMTVITCALSSPGPHTALSRNSGGVRSRLSLRTWTPKRTSCPPLWRAAHASSHSTSHSRPGSSWHKTPGGTVTQRSHTARVSATG
jgi:hypothetical protein